MPWVATGNTMAPCVVIGERAAEVLGADHRATCLTELAVRAGDRCWGRLASPSVIKEQRRFGREQLRVLEDRPVG